MEKRSEQVHSRESSATLQLTVSLLYLDERPVLDIYRKVREDGYMEIDICFPLK